MEANLKYKTLISEIWKLAMPISIQAVLVAGLQLVDNLFVGNLNNAKEVASGLNAFSNLNYIYFSLVSGFIVGIGVYFAQAASTKDKQLQQDLFKAKIIWSFILSCILLLIIMLCFKPLVSLWIPDKGSGEYQYSKEYGFIVMPSMIINYLILILANTFKETKKVKAPVIIAITALAINASLDYVLMYVANLGVRGSAIATLIAWLVELLIWAIYILKTSPDFIPKLREMFNIKFSFLRKVFFKPLIWSFDSVLITFAFTLQILFISRISTDAGASLNSAGVFPQLISAFINGFSQAISIMIAAFMAKNSNIDIRKYIKMCSLVSIMFGVVCGIMVIAISPFMFLIYPKYGWYVNFQSILMIIAIGASFWFKILSTVVITALKNSGFSKSIIIVDALISWLVPLPLTILLVYTNTGLSYGMIYLIVTISSVVQLPVAFTFYKKNINKIKHIVL